MLKNHFPFMFDLISPTRSSSSLIIYAMEFPLMSCVVYYVILCFWKRFLAIIFLCFGSYPNAWAVERYKVIGFVGIQTGFRPVGRWQSLRKSWTPADQQRLQRLENATGLEFMFVIGIANNKAKMAELRKEFAQYDDFMLLDIEEYNKPPYKMLAFFKVTLTLSSLLKLMMTYK